MKRISIAPFLPLFLTSCSLFYASTSSSVPLSAPTITTQNLREIRSQPYLYKFNIQADENGGNKQDAFITCVRECGLDHKRPSLVATTRRLLVGLNSLEILDQKETNLDGQDVIASRIKGRIDDQPILLATYSVSHQDCVTDVVGWIFSTSDQPTSNVKLTDLVEPVATQVAKELHAGPGN
jgi:hypothetical protein